jgi:hypothetical protein
MRPRWRLGTLALAVACVALLLKVSAFWFVPPPFNNPLAGIAEPITLTGYATCDDGGSRTLIFRDAQRREFYVCWVADEYGGNILPGRFAPLHGSWELRPYPVGGAGDRFVLGMLEGWSRRDAAAQRLKAQIDQAANGGTDAMTVEQKAYEEGLFEKYQAVRMLKELRRRCPAERPLR